MGALPVEDQFYALSKRLEAHHELFAMLWEIGAPVFTATILTAAVAFSSDGKPLRFLFNPSFWESLPEYDRQFVICHEMLHAVLNHGFRGADMLMPNYANIAADIAVNHLLVERFGFVRELLRDWSSACWVDTVFSSDDGRQLPRTNLTMEEYYELLLSRPFKPGSLMDEHMFTRAPNGSLRNVRAATEMDALLGELELPVVSDARTKLGKEASAVASRGTERVCAWCAVLPASPAAVPWEAIVRRRLRRKDREELKEGWVLPDRRFPHGGSLMPPGHAIQVSRENTRGRQKCVFFLDTSGSVFHLRHRFFALVKSLPEKQFDVVACSFDMDVKKLDLKRSEVFGGGGTSFSILEAWIQAERRRGKSRPDRYPDVVFVLTDGYGDTVKPEHPDRWHWLLTSDFTALAPKESATFLLKNYR